MYIKSSLSFFGEILKKEQKKEQKKKVIFEVSHHQRKRKRKLFKITQFVYLVFIVYPAIY